MELNDEFVRRVRDVLTDERHALPYALVSLDDVHAGAARRRRRRQATGALAAVAVLAAVGIPAALALTGDDRSGRLTATRVTHDVGSPSPGSESESASPPASAQPLNAADALPWDGAQAVSVTATSTRTLVVLGRAPGSSGCGPNDCLRLAATNDGGASYYAVPTPPARYGQVDGGVTDIRFGSGRDAWLYGDALWSTHDEGATWERQDLGGPVSRLAAARGTVWALVGAPDGLQQLYRSPVGSDDWEAVDNVVVFGPGDIATLDGRVVVAGARDDVPSWAGGPDGFTEHAGPCSRAERVELSANGNVWAQCVTDGTGTLMTSSDGSSWQSVPLPYPLLAPATVGARGSEALVTGIGTVYGLTRVTPAGDTTGASDSGLPGQVSYLGFTTPDVGMAVADGRLLRTTDGGASWADITP